MENKHYEPVAYLPKEQAERFQEFLKFSGIADIEMNVNETALILSVLLRAILKKQIIFIMFFPKMN